MNVTTEELNPDSPPSAALVAADLSAVSDTDLLEGWCRDHEPAALAALIERYSVMVLSVCRRRCRSEADAEDAFQTTFLYLARNGRKVRHPERLAGWLHRVAQRAAVATQKLSQRETNEMVEPPANPDDPLDRLTQRHEAILLDEELADLPEHYRSAIVMHLYEGHSIQKLADHFGTTIGSIRGRLQRGKQLLAQRLRRRGVVPIVAYASASTWTVSNSQATQASEALVAATHDGSLPDPPIDTPVLEPLLSQGIRLMPSIYAATGLLGGSALIALMMMTNGTQGQSPRQEVSFPPVVAQASEAVPIDAGGGNNQEPQRGSGGIMLGGNGGMSVGQMGGVGTGSENNSPAAQTGNPNTPGMMWTEKPRVPTPTSDTAVRALKALEGTVDLQFSGKLSDLPGSLSDALGIPVLIDERGTEFARVETDTTDVEYSGESAPLRTVLRKLLRPHGLKVIVEEEGFVITADPSALVHQKIGTTRWVNIDTEAEKRIAAALDAKTSIKMIELPLIEAVKTLGQQHGIPMRVDRRALEEIGLAGEEPVTLSMEEISLRSALRFMLRDLDLTYTVRGESLEITTTEAAESQLVTRIYWLEGTGHAPNDFQSIIDTLQTSIAPDTWEALGGPSTMAPLASVRPAIMIATTYDIHETIDRTFQTLRETHFGPDPILERVQIPLPPRRGGMGGMLGGGMGGGGSF